MKRLIAALLAALALFSFAGCGTNTETPEITDTPDITDMPDVTDTQEEFSPVRTDWSKLTPYEPEQLYTYHPGYRAGGEFEARDDYGTLIPYIGKSYDMMGKYVIGYLPAYGIVTEKGELVSDPVYTNVYCYDGFLRLNRNTPAANGGERTHVLTIASPDGSWVHELPGSYNVNSGYGLLLTSNHGSLDVWNAEGELQTHFNKELLTPWLGENYTWGDDGGPYINWTDDKVGYIRTYYVNGENIGQEIRLYLDFQTGAVTDTPPEGYPVEIDYNSAPASSEPPVIEGYRYLERTRRYTSGPTVSTLTR